jgi:hypothetical protein
MKMFIPVDKEESNDCIDSSLYGTPCGKPIPETTCKKLGLKLIEVIEQKYGANVPQKWIDNDDAWWAISGWECEVEQI